MHDPSRRSFIASLAAAASVSGASKQPNVVLLLADDLGWGNVGYHGSVGRTPHIDQLASEGVKLEHCYAYPVCSPTRSALMTGRSPMRFGVIYSVIRPWANYGVPVDEHFMPETFRAAGYQTAMTGKWHLGHANRRLFPNARGFQSFLGHLNGAIDYYTHEREGGLDWQRDGQSLREEGYSTDLIAAEAVRRIERRDVAKPLFLYVPFNAPHAPLQPPPGGLLDNYARIADVKQRTYAAMMESMDAGVGRILHAIDANNMAAGTIVLFLSDNGGPLRKGASNGSLRGGKAQAFEGGIRVPACIRWPGRLKAGTTSEQVMTVMDFLPTLAGACGIRPANTKPLDGRDMWDKVLNGRAEEREDLFFAIGPDDTMSLAARRGPWKLVRTARRSTREQSDLLFRIDEDPDERNDLAAREPARVQELGAALERWQALHPRQGLESASSPHPGWVRPADWCAAASSV